MWGRQLSDREELRLACTRNRAFGIGRTHRERAGPSWATEALHQRLPALASTFHGFESYEWNATLRTILVGVHDASSPFSLLRGKEETLVEQIFSMLCPKWGDKVTLTLPAYAIGLPHRRPRGSDLLKFDEIRGCHGRDPRPGGRLVPSEELAHDQSGKPLHGLVSFVSVKTITQFPEPMDRNINMMPFVFGDKESLPEEYQCYYALIEQCPYMEDEIGKVGYLTVQESFVEASHAQRREGIHIEAPGAFTDEDSSIFVPGREHSWGCGVFFGMDRLEGGIFMASTVADSCEIWDALVDKGTKGIVDRHGGCEHLRPLLGPGKKLKANELVWMTDRTPHEALAQTEPGYRQFFRVVSSKISHWFADHSTPNPLVPLPEHVLVVHGNKFEV